MKKNIKIFAREFDIKYINIFEYECKTCNILEILKVLKSVELDNFEIRSVLYKGSNLYIRKEGLKIIFHYSFKDRKKFKNKYYKFLSHPDTLKYFYVRWSIWI